jgi:hypothetical protein
MCNAFGECGGQSFQSFANTRKQVAQSLANAMNLRGQRLYLVEGELFFLAI